MRGRTCFRVFKLYLLKKSVYKINNKNIYTYIYSRIELSFHVLCVVKYYQVDLKTMSHFYVMMSCTYQEADSFLIGVP